MGKLRKQQRHKQAEGRVQGTEQLGCLLAEHSQVDLADDEGEDEVDADSDGLPSSSGLNVVELRGHQPPQGAPGPGKPSSVQALEGQNGGCRLPGDVASDLVEATAHDTGHDNEADEHLEATLSKQHLTAQPVETSCLVSRKQTNQSKFVGREQRALADLPKKVLLAESCVNIQSGQSKGKQ